MTIKLGITQGNIKAIQADTGHTQSKTLMDIYAHTYNEKRIKNSCKLKQTLYSDNQEEISVYWKNCKGMLNSCKP